MRERLLEHCALYRHYKGGLYYVVGQALHTETYDTLVIYHDLSGDKETFARPIDMFLSEVPEESEKDNVTNQHYRFELVYD